MSAHKPKQYVFTTPTIGGGISIHLSNVDSREAVFFGDVVSLFCDPAKADNLLLLQSGLASLRYDPGTGLMVLTPDITADNVTPDSFGRN